MSHRSTFNKNTFNSPIFVDPLPSLRLPADKILRMLLPLYGLPESKIFWFQTYHDNHINKLHMHTETHDLYFLYTPDLTKDPSEVKEATCVQTDDTLNIENDAFIEIE